MAYSKWLNFCCTWSNSPMIFTYNCIIKKIIGKLPHVWPKKSLFMANYIFCNCTPYSWSIETVLCYQTFVELISQFRCWTHVVNLVVISGLLLGLHPANERHRYSHWLSANPESTLCYCSSWILLNIGSSNGLSPIWYKGISWSSVIINYSIWNTFW